jgi:hypothetical protein
MQTKVKLTKRVVSLATALVTGLSAVGVTGIPGGYLERYLQAQRTVIITSTAFVLTRAVLRRMSRQQKKMVHIRSQTSTGSQSR